MSKEYLKTDEVVIMKFDTDWIYETILERIASNLGKLSNVKNIVGTNSQYDFSVDDCGNIILCVSLTKQFDKQEELGKYSQTDEFKKLPLSFVDNEILRNYGMIKLPIKDCLKTIDDNK